MHIMGEKTETADAPWSHQKTPCKKSSKRRKMGTMLPNLFREGAHMGKGEK